MDKESQIKEWSRLYGRQITEEEYKEISDNLRGFFDILHTWNKEGGSVYNEKKKESTGPID